MATVTVLTAAKILELLGHTLVGAKVVGNSLQFTTLSGEVINVGDVRGPSSLNKTATTTPFSPAGGIAASNVQSAIAELVGDITSLNANKADAADVTKVMSGTSRVNTISNTPVNALISFTSGYFTATPTVVVTLKSSVPERIPYTTITDVSTTGFRIWTQRSNDTDTDFCWIAVQ